MAEFKTDEGKLKEVCTILKSVLTSFGGELPMDQINNEYETVVGSSIPFKELKHGTLASLLQSMPGILRLQNRGGRLVVCVVNDENIDMILQQVKGQINKPSKAVQNKKKRAAFPSRQLHATPNALYQAQTYNPRSNGSSLFGNPWRTPTIPTRPKFYTNQQQHQSLQWRPVNPQPPPGFHNNFQSTRPSMSQVHPGNTANTSTFKVSTQQPAATQPTTKDRQKPTTSVPVPLNSLKTKAPVTEKPPDKKSLKQQLIDAVKELEAEQGKKGNSKLQLKFNSVPCGKKMEWCTVILIGEMRVSSYPDLADTQEKAEEAASQKALEMFPQLAKKRQLSTTTTDYTVSVPRVKQLLMDKSPNKRFWWDPLRDMYAEVYKEKLPQDWLAVVKVMTNTGLAFDNPCVDKWTIAVVEEEPPRIPKTQESRHIPKTQEPRHIPKTQEPRHIPKTQEPRHIPKTQEPRHIPKTQEPPHISKPQDPPHIPKHQEPPHIPKPQEPPHIPKTQDPRHIPKHQDPPHIPKTQESRHTPSPSPQNGLPKDVDSTGSDEKVQLPPISLPSTPTWDVFITCVEAGNTVQLLLVGEDYSGMYSELLTEMELHYMEEKNRDPVKEPVVGEIYVASHEESWLRVQLMEVLSGEVKVKFLDHGDSEAIPAADLYFLQDRFFSLPAQALQCCLAGLEDAPMEAGFQALNESLPMAKTLVARVQRRQEPYAIILFDTSTDEDVNLNDKVFESLAQHLVEPTLPPVGGMVEVYLTHASTEGTLYVQVESKTYKILEDLLKIAKRRTEEMLGENVQVDLTKLYLARMSKDEEWCRAVPKRTVDLNGKALPCCLHNVPSNPNLKWTVQACQRLLDFASLDTPLLLKVMSEGTTSQPPSVQLFKRLLPQNELVSINDTLGIDIKLFGSEGDSNNNSVEKEVVVSQFRSQQSSCASGATIQSLPSESPPIGPDSFPPCSPLCLNDIPDVGSYFDVFVTFAANPFHFAVQPWKLSKKFDALSESMQMYYHHPDNLKKVSAIKSDQYCAVKHSDDIWYRAKVEVVIDKSVSGVFVDFGDRFITSLEKVQPLAPDFCAVPCLAIKAGLHGIKAANKDWSPEDACRFRELTMNKNLVSTLYSKKTTNTDCLLVSLVLVDTSEKTVDVCINQLLVNEHRAVHY